MKLSISMTKEETLFGWLFMIAQLSVLPVILMLLNSFLPVPLSASALNFLMFVTGICLTVAIFHRFLGASARSAAAAPFRCLRFAALGLGLYYIGSFLIGLLISRISPDFSNVNDSAIQSMAAENYGLIAFGTVFLVPVTEETLYRGLLFQGLHSKSRIGAYLLSTVVFALIHVTGYIGTYPLPVLGLCLLQYLPAGLCLAWAYEKADSIWAPILMHMTINQISISFMG